MEFLNGIKESYIKAVSECFQEQISGDDILINETRKEFIGDYTFVIFPLVKPSALADKLIIVPKPKDNIVLRSILLIINLQRVIIF